MAHIVCITTSLAGLLMASCELLRRLQAAGHRVTYASHEDIEAIVTRHGIPFSLLESGAFKAFQDADRKRSRLDRLRNLSKRRREAVQALGVSTFTETLETLKPDLLLIDLELHQYIISAAPSGIPVALLSPFMSTWKRPGLPPLNKRSRPGVGWKGHFLGNELVWLNFRIWKFRERWKERKQLVGLDRISIFRALARKTGFPFLREAQPNQWLLPFSYRSLPTLCLRAIEFEFPHRPRPTTHYLGPMIDPEHRAHVTKEADPKIEDIIARKQQKGVERKLIYCGLSSVRPCQSDQEFLRRLIAAVEKRPQWDLVIGLGGTTPPESLAELPPNIHAFSWAPQLHVLQHADAAIVHGGMNSLDECISLAVPMVVYSQEVLDMPGSTARIAHHGLGVVGNRKHDSPEKMLSQIEQALTDPEMADRLRTMSTHYAKYAEEKRAEQVIDSLLTR